ncbi:MAG: thioredoxin [Thaumarchaeota archaeon]|nr:thioredoxin [Nitrososphaerota archaeon]
MSAADDKEIERINRRKFEELLNRRNQIQNQPPKQEIQRPIILTDANFAQEIAKNTLMVVDFWAPWCGPCRMVGPIIEELARDHSGRVVFGKLNVDENPVTASSFQVQSIPTILIFYQGQAVDGVLGAVPKSLLESKIRPYLSGTRSANPYH